jgi:2-keto-4-pentenoate hydratase/2-oxohepta-3-ene-1,7-dioic acid hydratase in catechol pathway
MKFATVEIAGHSGLAIEDGEELRGLTADVDSFPGPLVNLLLGGTDALAEAHRVLAAAPVLDPGTVTFRPPLARPPKILCVGANYLDHIAEMGHTKPDYPTVFARFAHTLVGHRQPLVRPRASTHFDYEGELAVIIGRRGRHVPRDRALQVVAGYSVFNDATLRDYQRKTPQWTLGKNFDSTGGFGPWLVTADALPPGAAGLKLETRLNGRTVQSSSTGEIVFDVPTLIATLSEVLTLEPGDVIITGTPAGVGAARTPPLWMTAGDLCEITIEGIGTLANPVVDEAA